MGALAAGLGVVIWAAGCTVPITGETLTGGALNAGAMLFVNQLNARSYEGEGYYNYDSEVGADTLAAIFEAAVESANRAFLFAPATSDTTPDPEGPPPLVASEGAIVLARAPTGGAPQPETGPPARTDAAPAPSGMMAASADDGSDPMDSTTFPGRQWTPAPLFSVEPGSPVARSDTLLWVVTHRARRQVAFLLVPRRGGAVTTVALVPYDPAHGIFLSVPTDHAQRNAVEALHEAFYLTAVEHLGRGVFVDEQGMGP